jgi:hypothetical protein
MRQETRERGRVFGEKTADKKSRDTVLSLVAITGFLFISFLLAYLIIV